MKTNSGGKSTVVGTLKSGMLKRYAEGESFAQNREILPIIVSGTKLEADERIPNILWKGGLVMKYTDCENTREKNMLKGSTLKRIEMLKEKGSHKELSGERENTPE